MRAAHNKQLVADSLAALALRTVGRYVYKDIARMKKAFTIMTTLFISACIALPATREVTNSNCDLVTREMYVDSHTLNNFNLNVAGNGEGIVVLAATGLVIYSVSWVISGSIVLTGNTIHWLETKGRCNERVKRGQNTDFSNISNNCDLTQVCASLTLVNSH